MKNILIAACSLFSSCLVADASTIVVSFGINSSSGGTTVQEGTYLGQGGQKVNVISSTSSASYTSNALMAAGGDLTGITLTTGGVCCGAGGVMTETNVKGSGMAGHSNKFHDVFGRDMTLGNPLGGCVNVNGALSATSGFTLSLNNLSLGSYTLTILAGRGNNYGSGFSSSYSLGGTNVSNISATLDDYSTGSAASINGATATGTTHTGDWMLVTYTFDVTADHTQLDISALGGSASIGALALTSVPEPAASGLGLLGLAALGLRRRR